MRGHFDIGDDYAIAVRKWAKLEANVEVPAQNITFTDLAIAYLRSAQYRSRAIRTQKDYEIYLSEVLKFFGEPPAPIEQIEPHHIAKYMEWRKESPTRANREKAIISLIWNHARQQGITKLPNPCAGIKGYTETCRNVYVEDDIYQWVWQESSEPLRDAIDLAYLTGQRPADILKLQETDIKDGHLVVTQGKTGQKLRIEITGQLAQVIARISTRKQAYKVRTLSLICNESGQKLSYSAMDNRFEHARNRAITSHPDKADEIKQFQFRDLRAKAGTDKADAQDMQAAQLQLGHKSIKTTEIYIRAKKGQKVSPTK